MESVKNVLLIVRFIKCSESAEKYLRVPKITVLTGFKIYKKKLRIY
jgi:hypothetical protein